MSSKQNVAGGRNHSVEEKKRHEKRERKTLLDVITNYSKDKSEGPRIESFPFALLGVSVISV